MIVDHASDAADIPFSGTSVRTYVQQPSNGRRDGDDNALTCMNAVSCVVLRPVKFSGSNHRATTEQPQSNHRATTEQLATIQLTSVAASAACRLALQLARKSSCSCAGLSAGAV